MSFSETVKFEYNFSVEVKGLSRRQTKKVIAASMTAAMAAAGKALDENWDKLEQEVPNE